MPEGRLVIGTRRYSSWSLRGWLPVRLAALDVEEVVIPLAGGPPGDQGRHPVRHGALSGASRRPGLGKLAIAEYCAEILPSLWPSERGARAWARAIAAEMHAGFGALRRTMPMILGRTGAAPHPEALADIARIDAIWREACRFRRSVPVRAGFGNADAMYAPVVCRFLTYGPDLSPVSRAYCEAVRGHPLMGEWYDRAAQEPLSWRLAG